MTGGSIKTKSESLSKPEESGAEVEADHAVPREGDQEAMDLARN